MNYSELNGEVVKLVKIMKKLRGPEGCPWDRKQDYYSLKPYIIEEAYEVVEALEKENINMLKEELGDLLLQVVFQAQIGRERDEFDLKDIFYTVSEKMIRRHPHVFGDKTADDVSEVMINWENIKDKEKKDRKQKNSLLDGISRSSPALNQAYEVQAKAAGVGFDWDEVTDVVAKIEEELNEVQEAIKNNKENEVKDELGDLLFAVVNLARFFSVDPEVALIGTIIKFKDRFKYIEEEVDNKGHKIIDLSLDELDKIWEESKKEE